MGRHKKPNESNQDPIVKRIRKHKKPKKQEEEELDEPNSQEEGFLENLHKNTHVISLKEQKTKETFFDKFQKSFSNKKQIPQELPNQALNRCTFTKAQYKQKHRSMIKLQINYKNDKTPFDRQFNRDIEEVKSKCQQYQPHTEKISNLFDEIEENKPKEKGLKQTLNNGIDVQELNIMPDLKRKQVYEVAEIEEEDYFTEDLIGNNLTFSGEKIDLNRKTFLTSAVQNYYDLSFIDPEEDNSEFIRDLYCRHTVNHISNYQGENQQKGFTRCKVLILCPFKGDAMVIINKLISLQTEDHLNRVSYRERFETQFCDEERLMEDDFRFGMTLSKKCKLFANFDKADVIIASPLGLRLIVGSEADSLRENHFLSSIEILIIDRANAICMQNWQHLETVLDNINLLPEHKFVSSSLDEIRPYFWEKKAKLFRQNIVYSEHAFSELNFIQKKYFQNHNGGIQNRLYYPPILKTVNQQDFISFEGENEAVESRFQQFIKMWNIIEGREAEQYQKTVIFVQSYFDFVKLKRHFAKVNSEVQYFFTSIRPKVQSALSKFNSGQVPFIMFTERAYFFEVCQVKRMKHLLFYQLPHHAYIYKDLIECLGEQKNPKIITLFCKYDAYQLEQIVGSQQTQEMMRNKGSTFVI